MSPTEIDLHWSLGASTIIGIQILRATGDGNGNNTSGWQVVAAILPAGSTSYQDKTALAGVDYNYQAVPINSDVPAPPSNVAAAKSSAIPIDPNGDNPPPGYPGGPTDSGLEFYRVSLTNPQATGFSDATVLDSSLNINTGLILANSPAEAAKLAISGWVKYNGNDDNGGPQLSASVSDGAFTPNGFDLWSAGHWHGSLKLSVAEDGEPDAVAIFADVTPAPLGLSLGDGSANQVLIGSNDGVTDLVQLHLTVPTGLANGTQIVLSTTAPDKIDVWNNATPSVGDTTLLGGTSQTSSITWTVGVDTIPITIYLGATQGSTNVGDIGFTLAAIVGGAATQPAASQPASAIKAILSTVDPNNAGILNKDVTGQNLQWVVGQTVDLKAVVTAPAGLALKYTWDVPGNYLYSYTQTVTKGAIGALIGDNQGTGTNDPEVKFFWVTTKTPADIDNVVLTVTPAGGEKISKQVTFTVNQPTSTFTGTPWQKANGFMTKKGALGLGIKDTAPMDLAFGDKGAGQAGMTFNGTVNTNAIEEGMIEIVQLVRFIGSFTKNGVQTPMNTGSHLLDDVEPATVEYSGSPIKIGNGDQKISKSDDTPGSPLSADMTHFSGGWDYRTFLMYKPIKNGNWVPISEINWSLDATVVFNNGSWQFNKNSTPNDVENGSGTRSEPEWSSDIVTWKTAQ